MITVTDSDGHTHEFEDASKISTDEHNNLEVFEGKPGQERLAFLFNRTHWQVTEVDYGES
jgi:hypothetical protein